MTRFFSLKIILAAAIATQFVACSTQLQRTAPTPTTTTAPVKSDPGALIANNAWTRLILTLKAPPPNDDWLPQLATKIGASLRFVSGISEKIATVAIEKSVGPELDDAIAKLKAQPEVQDVTLDRMTAIHYD